MARARWAVRLVCQPNTLPRLSVPVHAHVHEVAIRPQRVVAPTRLSTVTTVHRPAHPRPLSFTTYAPQRTEEPSIGLQQQPPPPRQPQPISNIRSVVEACQTKEELHAAVEEQQARKPITRWTVKELDETLHRHKVLDGSNNSLFSVLVSALHGKLQAVQEHPRFTPRRLSFLVQRVVQVGSSDQFGNLFDVVAQLSITRIREFNPQDVSTMLWSYATAGVPAPGLFVACKSVVEQRRAEFKPENLALTAFAYSKSGIVDTDIFAMLAEEATKSIQFFNAQYLTMILMACGTSGVHVPEFFSVATKAASQKEYINKATPRDLTNSAFALATAFKKSGGNRTVNLQECHVLLRTIAALAPLESFTHSQLASFLWACSSLHCRLPEVFIEAQQHLVADLGALTPSKLGMLLWSYAKAEVHTASLLLEATTKHLRSADTDRLDSFAPEDICQVVWSYARLRAGDDVTLPVFYVLAPLVSSVPLTPQAVSILVWSYVSAGVQSATKEWYIAMARRVATLAPHFSPPEISMLTWAFSKLTSVVGSEEREEHFDNVFRVLEPVAVEKLQRFNATSTANTLWAYANSGIAAPALFAAVAADTSASVWTDNLRPQSMAHVVYSYARTLSDANETPSPKVAALFQMISAHAIRRLEIFKPYEVTMLVRAFADVGVPVPALYDAVSNVFLADDRLKEINPKDLNLLDAAFDQAGHPSQHLKRHLSQQ